MLLIVEGGSVEIKNGACRPLMGGWGMLSLDLIIVSES